MSRWNRTHESLRRAAFELFAHQGYESTATAQIAKQAGVSEMTLFRHFSSKEALLLADPFDPLIADAVLARPSDEPPMRALAEGIRQTWKKVDDESIDALRTQLRIIAKATGLGGAIERNSTQTIAALAGALVSRGTASVAAHVAATAMISGLSVALLEWAGSGRAPLEDALGEALDTLGGA